MSFAHLRARVGGSLPDEEISRLLESHHGDASEAASAFYNSEGYHGCNCENVPVQAYQPRAASGPGNVLRQSERDQQQHLVPSHSPGPSHSPREHVRRSFGSMLASDFGNQLVADSLLR